MNYDVKTIANLAHIHLNDDREDMLHTDFGNILEYVAILSDLDLDENTIPTYHTSTLRQDIGFESNPRFSPDTKIHILQEMPLTEDGYLVVKSVLKKTL